MKDPIIEEIHKVRRQIEKECEEKGISYFDHILEYQKKFKGKLVSNASKPKHAKINSDCPRDKKSLRGK